MFQSILLCKIYAEKYISESYRYINLMSIIILEIGQFANKFKYRPMYMSMTTSSSKCLQEGLMYND